MGARQRIAVVGALAIAAAAGIAWWAGPLTTGIEAQHATASRKQEATFATPAASSADSRASQPAQSAPKDLAGPTTGQSTISFDGSRVGEQLREHMRADVELFYEDVGQKVGLDEAESRALRNLLLDQRIRYAEANFGEGVAGVAAIHEFTAQQWREIEAQIGPARTALLGDYEHSMEARVYVDELRQVLEAASLPLTEIQRKDLIQQAIERGAYLTGAIWTGAESDLAMRQEMQAKSDLRDQRFQGIARSVLRPDQFERYEAWTEMQRQASQVYMRSLETAPPTH